MTLANWTGWARTGAAIMLALTVNACAQPPVEAPEIVAQAAPLADLPPDLVASAPQGVLPAVARPLVYDLAMDIDPRQPGFGGVATIRIALDEAAEGVWLHGRGLAVSSVSVTAPDGKVLGGTWKEVLPSGVAWVGFGEEVPAGEITAEIAYTARFDNLLRGLFKVEEQGEAYALAKSESIQARRFLPGFDEPGYKVPFNISLTVPEGYEAISNAPEVSRVPARPGFETVTFAETRPLSTYLLSVAVGPFDVVEFAPLPPNEVRSEPIPLRGFARKGRGAELAYALETTAPLTEAFELALKKPYPYRKLDIIAAPQWPSGATELAGAITYRESRILYNDTLGPAARRALLGIHTHELAHMWFGDLVTPPWWDDLWLKESFATWGTPLALIEFEPQGGHEIDTVTRALGAMGLDSLQSARAIREPITRNENVRNAYDAITYSKGMAVINMVDAYFGPDKFRPALGEYISEFEDGVANSEDFYRVIGEVSGEPELTNVFRSFVEQSGLPMISANLGCDQDGQNVVLEQSQYAPLGSSIDPDAKEWTAPVCVAYGFEDGRRGQTCTLVGDTGQLHWFDAGSCPAWIHPNAGGAGYYRWDLDTESWEGLVANFDALTPGEALSAVDSAVAAFEAGGGDAASLFGIIEAAASANNPRVVAAPLGAISRYVGRINDPAAKAAMRSYAGSLYRGHYDRLAGATGEGASLLRNRLESFLATTARDPEIRADLAARASAFIGLDGPRQPDALSSDVYGVALAVGVEDLGVPFFNKLLAARLEIDDPRFAASAAAAVGTTRAPELVERVRTLIYDGSLGPRETYDLLAGQMSGSTRDDTWVWLRENYPRVIGNIPGTWPRRTPRLASGFCDTARVAELDALFEEHGALAEGYQQALEETKELISLCAAFSEARRAELEAAALALMDLSPNP